MTKVLAHLSLQTAMCAVLAYKAPHKYLYKHMPSHHQISISELYAKIYNTLTAMITEAYFCTRIVDQQPMLLHASRLGKTESL